MRLYLLSPMRLSLSPRLAYSPWALGIVHPAQISCTTISNNALERAYPSSTHSLHNLSARVRLFTTFQSIHPLCSDVTPCFTDTSKASHDNCTSNFLRARVTERLGLGWWQHLKCMARTQNDTNFRLESEG